MHARMFLVCSMSAALFGCRGGGAGPLPDGGPDLRGDLPARADAGVRVPLPLSGEGRTTSEVTLKGASGLTLRIPAGTEVRLDEGATPKGTVEVVLDDAYAAYSPAASGVTVLAQVRVGLRHGGTDVGGFFRHVGAEGPEGIALVVAATSGLQAGDTLLLYVRRPASPEAGERLLFSSASEWKQVQGEIWTGGEGTVRVRETGVFLVARRAARLAEVPERGFELVLRAGKKVALIKLVEESTSHVLAGAAFSCDLPEHRSKVHVSGDPARNEAYHLWLESQPDGSDEVHVVSPFANQPLAWIHTCEPGNPEQRRLGLEGPYRWQEKKRGALVEKPYTDCTLDYHAPVEVEVRTYQGGYAEVRRDVVAPLRDAFGWYEVALNFCGCGGGPAPTGCYCQLHVDTRRCPAEVAAAVKGKPVVGLWKMRVSLVYQAPLTVQAMVDAARDGDVVVVPPGVYRENVDLKGKAIELTSADPSHPEKTILEGAAEQPIVTFRSGETAATKLRGFTLRGGVASGADPDTSLPFFWYAVGGAVLIHNSSPVVEHNVFGTEAQPNRAWTAGGCLYVAGASTALIRKNFFAACVAGVAGPERTDAIAVVGDASPELRDNRITSSPADPFAELGRGILLWKTKAAVLRANVIEAIKGEGLVLRDGAAALIEGNTIRNSLRSGVLLECPLANVTLRANTIEGNETGLHMRRGPGEAECAVANLVEANTIRANKGSGGVILHPGVRILLKGNTIEANEAVSGGGLWVNDAFAGEVTGNTIKANKAADMGGGIFLKMWGDPALAGTIIDNTITGNSAKYCGGITSLDGIHTTVKGNTVTGNIPDDTCP